MAYQFSLKKGYNISMYYALIVPSYLVWHYGAAFRDITRVWTNFLWFFNNFFSMTLLAKTFFAPWRRIQESRGPGFSLENIAEAVVTNTVMRFMGALMRFVILLVGGIVILFFFWVGVVFFAVWLLLPALLIASFFYGLAVLIV